MGVGVVSLRRAAGGVVEAAGETVLAGGDTLVLSGRPEPLALAEEKLLGGG
jgi:CPA2 family monovalent cation:H+ antiporter-2